MSEEEFSLHQKKKKKKKISIQKRNIIVARILWIVLSIISMIIIDDAEKSPVSHTILTLSKQYLHSKKRRTNREHWCGAGQILSEGQVRTFHNSKVPELGWIMHTLICKGLGGFYSSIGLTSPPWLRRPFLVGVFMNIFCGTLSL